eukprot:TRINITY_DN3782_c0_g1_i9.p3 TRINITY_DN3782_c0_g1~~TRINITY_DN3782_c0_g1_i9.p3  ORF type:complete len:161 (-),score=1.06 TRINITY_DN3782_c0_g1_i9:145-627(-)
MSTSRCMSKSARSAPNSSRLFAEPGFAPRYARSGVAQLGNRLRRWRRRPVILYTDAVKGVLGWRLITGDMRWYSTRVYSSAQGREIQFYEAAALEFVFARKRERRSDVTCTRDRNGMWGGRMAKAQGELQGKQAGGRGRKACDGPWERGSTDNAAAPAIC